MMQCIEGSFIVTAVVGALFPNLVYFLSFISAKLANSNQCI